MLAGSINLPMTFLDRCFHGVITLCPAEVLGYKFEQNFLVSANLTWFFRFTHWGYMCNLVSSLATETCSSNSAA